MIEILCVIHKNYDLYWAQIEHWKQFSGDFKLIFCDNTPDTKQTGCSPIGAENVLPGSSHQLIKYSPSSSFDGQSHGETLDYLVQQASTDIIGIIDSDFFWLDKDIILWAEKLFREGYKCVGASAFYNDWVTNIEPVHPAHHHMAAPIVWGMFVHRQLAAANTFCCSPEEGSRRLYTGYKLRQYLIDNPAEASSYTLPGYHVGESVVYHDQGTPKGIHYFKGSFKSLQAPKLV